MLQLIILIPCFIVSLVDLDADEICIAVMQYERLHLILLIILFNKICKVIS